MISKQLYNPFKYTEFINNEIDICCDNPNIDYSNGTEVCTNCGIVIGQSLVMQERRIYDKTELLRKQNEVPYKDCGYRTIIPWKELPSNRSLYHRLSKIQQSFVSSLERNIWEARPQFKQLCDKLNIPDYIRATAWKIYLRCANKKLTMGRGIEIFLGSSLYVAIRIHKFPRLFDEVKDEMKSNDDYRLLFQRSVGMIIRQVLPELHLKYSNITAKELVPYFCTRLTLPIQIQFEANLLLTSAYNRGLRDDGKDPAGLAAAAIYIASNRAITQENLSVIAKCTEVTLRSRIKELKKYVDMNEFNTNKTSIQQYQSNIIYKLLSIAKGIDTIKEPIKTESTIQPRKDMIKKSIIDHHIKITPEKKQQIIDLKKSGAIISKIVSETKISICSISKVLKEAGLVGLARSKITPSEVKQKIIQLRKSGATKSEIIREIEVSFGIISKVIKETGLARPDYKTILTPELRQQIIEMRTSGVMIDSIINDTQLNNYYVKKVLKEAGLIKHIHQAKITTEIRQQVINMKKAGATRKEIVSKTNVSDGSISIIYRQAGMNQIKSQTDYIGSITPELKEKIIEMRKSESTINDIVIATHVSFYNVHKTLKEANLI